MIIINLKQNKMKPPKSYLENPNTIKANKELVKVLNKMFGKKK